MTLTRFIFKLCFSWPSGLPGVLPSPASPSAVIVSPETLSRHSSSSPSRAHRPVAQFDLALPCLSQQIGVLPTPMVCYPAPTYLDVVEDRSIKNLGAWVPTFLIINLSIQVTLNFRSTSHITFISNVLKIWYTASDLPRSRSVGIILNWNSFRISKRRV